jgi:hypothetical protein
MLTQSSYVAPPDVCNEEPNYTPRDRPMHVRGRLTNYVVSLAIS